MRPVRGSAGAHDKRLATLEAVFDAFEIGDGAVLSFHHHYRNGDRLMNAVVEIAARRGLRGLTLAPSSLFPVHAPLAAHIHSGVIARVITDYAKGPLTDALTCGALAEPLILQSHGGRARAITTGALKIDAAFVGAPLARPDGAATGRGGVIPCGPLGYAQVDAAHARRTVICAHEITDAPLPHTDIPADQVDAVVAFDRPGDSSGIASDTTLPSATAQAVRVGALVADVVEAAGLLRPGLSLQSGAGGYSLGAVPAVGRRMADRGVTGAFLSGGITGAHVALHRAGLFERIHDVQCFDLAAVASSCDSASHHAMSASEYANPQHPAPIVEDLSVMLLGAVEIDRNFDVNVTLGGDGRLIGGPGGHPDAAQGAALSIVTTGLNAGGYAKLVADVRMVTTPGVDVVVTDAGIAVSPMRPDLRADLIRAGLPVREFDALQAEAQAHATRHAAPPSPAPRLFVEDRCGGVLDWG